ncbi:MAG: DUF5686 and carboxypeptidase regulatory-like domain-containing protein, partial [Bacteroidales bacterium]|nr:DUF5686 and carboxypeptidase regulatory-like domain-containing protein [Bacteroidales bacterium]
MNHRILLLPVLLFCSATAAQAQILKGKIVNSAQQPVQYSTVYIQELRQGTVANINGDYEIKLPAGTYTAVYQSLGYEPVAVSVSVTGQTATTRNVTLPVQYYQVQEVTVRATGEDPAYGIMRKAIGAAGYHLNSISHYRAEMYLKGSLVFNRIPKLIQRSIKKSDGNMSSVKTGDAFMMESLNEIEYTAPGTYSQKTVSHNSTFPSGSGSVSPMAYVEASFYQPVIAGMAISPLSPKAFSYYRFKYLGATRQNNRTIHKIEVIPKRKSQQVFEGVICIIDALWCLQSVDLLNSNYAAEIRVRQLYIPVHGDMWMPVSHNFEISTDIIGLEADIGYAVSIKYTDVKPNTALAIPSLISPGISAAAASPGIDTSGAANASATAGKIERILEKEKLTDRNAIRIARLMDREVETAMNSSPAGNSATGTKITRTVDQNAGNRDSTYWAHTRPVPLTATEIRSLAARDSMKTVHELRKPATDTAASAPPKRGKFAAPLKHAATGHTWRIYRNDTTVTHRLRWGGLVDPGKLRFNTVDGFVYGFSADWRKYFASGASLSVYPEASWAFSRKTPMLRANAVYYFNSSNQSQLYMRAGSESRDMGSGGSINPRLNSIASLFFERNCLKLYDSRFATPGYRTTITPGLVIDISATLENRSRLENTTLYSIINTPGDYTPNTPASRYTDTLMPPANAIVRQHHAAITASLSFTPFMSHTVVNGHKIPQRSSWPTFSLTWRHGTNRSVGAGTAGISHYDMIRLEILRQFDNMPPLSDLSIMLRTGTFIDSRSVPFADFFHFNAQPLPVLFGTYRDAFMLPARYALSTPEAFAEFHIRYATPYLLLKLLPGLSSTLLKENISLAFLAAKNNGTYTEAGYSISEIFFMAELG